MAVFIFYLSYYLLKDTFDWQGWGLHGWPGWQGAAHSWPQDCLGVEQGWVHLVPSGVHGPAWHSFMQQWPQSNFLLQERPQENSPIWQGTVFLNWNIEIHLLENNNECTKM